MLSLLTNTAATNAIEALRSTRSRMEEVQSQVSTGLRVGKASDDPVAWSIAQSTDADVAALGAAQTAFGTSSSVLSTAGTAVTAVLTALRGMATVVSSLQAGSTTAAAAQASLAAQQQTLLSVVGSASFAGVNLLDGTAPSSIALPGTISRDSAGGVTLGTLALSTAGAGGTQVGGAGGVLGTALGAFSGTGVSGAAGTGAGVGTYAAGSLLAVDLTSASSGDLATISARLTSAEASVAAIGATLGGRASTVSTMQGYASTPSDALTSGVGGLVDADVNVASTRLQALQTQQELAVQVLGIANQQGQLILRLFGIS